MFGAYNGRFMETVSAWPIGSSQVSVSNGIHRPMLPDLQIAGRK
jgi:hypothetical protein